MARSYNLANVVCTLGPVTVEAFGEDEAVTVEWAEKLTEETVTADGFVIFNRLNDRRLHVSLHLNASSNSLPLLQAQLEAQHQDNLGVSLPVIPPLVFFLFDPATGTTYTGEAVITSRPAMSFGKTVGEVVWELTLPNPRYEVGVRNVLPF
jgi:hypothetical protein